MSQASPNGVEQVWQLAPGHATPAPAREVKNIFCPKEITMNGRFVNRRQALFALIGSSLLGLPAMAAQEAPDALIRRLYADIMLSLKGDEKLQAGDITRALALVENVIMPNVNFQRMVASAVGPAWRQATPVQKQRLAEEFKILLVRTYAGAMLQASDHVLVVKPVRMSTHDTEVMVRTEARGQGDPIQLDCRLEKTQGEGAGWKIFDLNVMGVWLGAVYRNQFAQEINARGVDGLITSLRLRNKTSDAQG